MLKRQEGAAPLEAIFAIVFVMMLALAVVQVSLTLYARNVVASAAHEGARAAIEMGRSASDARAIVHKMVRSAAGKLITDLDVAVSFVDQGERESIGVRVRGSLRPLGVVPIPISFDSTARSSRPIVP